MVVAPGAADRRSLLEDDEVGRARLPQAMAIRDRRSQPMMAMSVVSSGPS
jgi:hypothetical protein